METYLQTQYFESLEELSTWAREANPGSITLDTKIKRDGNSSGRFELNANDPEVSGGKRVEIKAGNSVYQKAWYSVSTYFPATFLSDPVDDVITQWHESPDRDLGEDWRSPPLSLRTKNDRFYFYIGWSAKPNNSTSTGGTFYDGKLEIDLGAIPKNRWVDWVYEINFSFLEDGFIKVWKNGKIVVERTGPNCYNDAKYPYFKIGIYKPGWKTNPNLSSVNKRVVHFARVRVGDPESRISNFLFHK